MHDDKEFLGREPIKKLLFRLAVPTVVAQLVNMLYNVIDRIYIGHMPENGALALTGVGVCMPIILMVSAFAALVSSGGAPRASIEMGRKNDTAAENILGNCFSLLLIISAVLTAILLLFNRQILLLFGASENTIEYAVSYMNVYAIGTAFVQLKLGLNMFITAQGFVKTGMLTVLIGAVLNLVLDPLFIFAFDMGVQGAALATILSQAASCVWCIVFLCGKKTRLQLRGCYLALKGEVIVPCVTLGLAIFIMQISESVIAACFNSSLLKYGGDIAVGAMTICTSTMQFAMLPMQGIGLGAQPISSYNYGARNAGRVKETFHLLLKVCMTYSVVLWLAIMLFPRVFAGIFSGDAALLDYSVGALRIYCAAIFLFGIQIACQLTFTSVGNAVCSIIVAVVRKFVLLIPLIYIVPSIGILENKALDVYLAEPIADVIAVAFTSILFYFQFRKALKKLNTEEVA
jgi:putative MATE family efflux protein